MLPGIERSSITLGLLAGGRASRLGGRDKAWLRRDGVPQVVRWQRAFEPVTATTLVSANRNLDRYDACGLAAVPDGIDGVGGPIAGLAALAGRCATEWLFTLPVDVIEVDAGLVMRLGHGRREDGAFARDSDGRQPLVALWRAAALRAAVERCGTTVTAVHVLQAGMRMHEVAFSHARFGNLNTPADLAAANVEDEE